MKSHPLARRDFLGMMIACSAAATAGVAGAREDYEAWTPDARAEVAIEFMVRMRQEFLARAKRLEKETGKPFEISLPFIESQESKEEKVLADWKRFTEGGMGEGGTSKWIDKALKELETVRRKLAAAEKPAAAAWEKKYKDNPPQADIPPEQKAFIYEMDVQANQLAVIMDNSESMTPYLAAVQAEIGARFKGVRFVEVNSSYLDMPSPKWGKQGEWFYTTPPPEHRNLFDPKWWLAEIPQSDIHFHYVQWERDTTAAMKAMAENLDVDAIYWFCDFDDKINPRAIRELEKILTENKVRLYVHTVKSDPPPALGNVIKKSGGSLTKSIPAKSAP